MSTASPADGVVLRASGLTLSRAGRRVLDGVDLEVGAGEIVAILGPNGAGKSTLLAALGGLLTPDAGTVEHPGRVASALQATGLARRTARANVELALGWWGVPRWERRPHAERALQAMGAGHLASRSATGLSGGEQRRVHLARALAVPADVLLLDEPFAGLDASTRASLIDDSGSALRASGRATVVVVHERAEAWALADRRVIVMDGAVAATGSPRDVLLDPPTPAVARFLGFDGEVREGAEILLTRPAHVRVVAGGDRRGTVGRIVPIEDGARVEVEISGGRVSALVDDPSLRVGDEVTVEVSGGTRFPAPFRGPAS